MTCVFLVALSYTMACLQLLSEVVAHRIDLSLLLPVAVY